MLNCNDDSEIARSRVIRFWQVGLGHLKAPLLFCGVPHPTLCHPPFRVGCLQQMQTSSILSLKRYESFPTVPSSKDTISPNSCERGWPRVCPRVPCWPGNQQHLEGWMDSALTRDHLQPLRFSPSWPRLYFQPHLLRSPLKASSLSNLVYSQWPNISVL